MEKTLLGRFYFKRTANGNLIGEFSNNIDLIIFTESAIAQTTTKNYVGKYNSTWLENNEPQFANLEISPKPTTLDRIFIIEWKSKDGRNFIGEGMLCEEILIGDYRETP